MQECKNINNKIKKCFHAELPLPNSDNEMTMTTHDISSTRVPDNKEQRV